MPSTSQKIHLFSLAFAVEFLGNIIGLCQSRRGVQQSIRNIDQNRIIMHYKLPLNEIVVDFYDSLKSLSSGYATFDYEELGFELSHLVKVSANVLCSWHIGNIILRWSLQSSCKDICGLISFILWIEIYRLFQYLIQKHKTRIYLPHKSSNFFTFFSKLFKLRFHKNILAAWLVLQSYSRC